MKTLMKQADTILEEAIYNWRDNKGVGTALIPAPFNDKAMLLGVLQRLFINSPNIEILIVTNTFDERIDIIEYLTTQEEQENNEEFKKLIASKQLKLLSVNLIKSSKYPIRAFVTILYHVEDICDKVLDLMRYSKFKLAVLNKLPSAENINRLYSVAPLLNAFKQNELDEVRTTIPVEDMWISVDIPTDTETYKLLQYYNDYISTSLSIFGSFELMQQARTGNPAINMSANQLCAKIAEENGWNDHLDMTIELNIQLDELYNPGSIKERADKTYEIIRNRGQLLTDYEGKLDEILKLVKEHETEKILIISKRGEFASKITEYLNNMSETIICGDYHDKVRPIPATDVKGNPVYFKSGANKGKRKYMHAQAQKKRNELLFNNNDLYVLSANAAPDKSLNTKITMIIITSPLCEDIKNYLYRLANVQIDTNCLKLYHIFVRNTLEEVKLQNKPIAENHTIISENKIVVNDENNSDFIVVD